MTKKIFVNLPVKDLNQSKEFFGKLGYAFNPQFTNDSGACMVVSDSIYVMLLRSDFFQTFIPHAICDTQQSTEALVCLSCDSKEEVKHIVENAVSAGAATFKPPQDHGFMYGQGFRDLDGHIWEYMWMDPSFIQPS